MRPPDAPRARPIPVICIVVLLLGVVAGVARAQPPPPPPPPPPQGVRPPGPPPPGPPGSQPRLRVFLDCYECDQTYLRQNVEFIDYVREPAVADLHVLVTTQDTGGGGLSWTAKFIGLGRLQGHDHTVTFTTPQTATSDDRRREFAKYFKIGLVAYAADTPVAGQIEISWRRPTAAAAAAAAVKDPWNYWVFRVGANGNFNGESLSKYRSYRLSFSANRTTEQWKVNLNVNGNVNENEFEIDDERTIKTRTDSWSTNAAIVKSLGPKWSTGVRSSVSHSSFSNTDRSVSLTPGIEFDFFPYSEWSRRSLTVLYSIGVTRYEYRELTVYDKLLDAVPSHSVSVNLSLRQPWGSLNVYPSFSQHLNHLDRYRSSIWGSTDVRLFKGFSFNVFAEYNKIKDQISLRKGEATEEEVLLRLRQLATDYSYYVGFGVSYSFGSIFNSVVNPRFGG